MPRPAGPIVWPYGTGKNSLIPSIETFASRHASG
jgi:hypothetical protein